MTDGKVSCIVILRPISTSQRDLLNSKSVYKIKILQKGLIILGKTRYLLLIKLLNLRRDDNLIIIDLSGWICLILEIS